MFRLFYLQALCAFFISFTPSLLSFNSCYAKDLSDIGINEKKASDTTPSINSFDFFVSNRGSDTNDGKSASTPKLNISSIERIISGNAGQSSVLSLNLEENSFFREQYNPVNNGQNIKSFNLKTPRRLAKITGMDVMKDWSESPGFSNVFQRNITAAIDVSSPAYTYIMVAEIDTALEKTHPIAAVKYLQLVSNIAVVNTNPGTFYTPDVTNISSTVYIRPSQGIPGKNKYRYEVTTRNYAISGYNVDNATYENLLLQTSAYGYGMLSAGKNSSIKNVIFLGGGTHHAVIKSGSIDSSLFLPGPKGLKDRIAAVFYNAEGTGGVNRITNTIFLNIPNAVYTHTNGSINHKSLVLDKVYAFADTTDAGTALSSNDTDSIDVTNCYVEGYPTGWYGGGSNLNIKNSIFRKTDQSAIGLFTKPGVKGKATISNVLIQTNGNDANQNVNNGWTAYGIRSSYSNVDIEVSNSIIHDYSTYRDPAGTVTTFGFAGLLKAHHNIYICDVNSTKSVHMYRADNSGGKGTSSNVTSDYNVYVLLRGSNFHWNVSPYNNLNESNITTLAEWQSLTGQDKNSILLDLRDNPLGLKALFVDPEKGNWSLAQTAEAESIRRISAGMTTPPLYYPKRPYIEEDGIPYKTPGGFSLFSGSLTTESESIVKWQTFNENQFSSFTIEYSFDGITFTDAGNVTALNDGKSNSYQFIHSHYGTDSIFYRLKATYTDNATSTNSIIKLSGNFSQELKITVYPNPFQQFITVLHPRRDVGEIRIYDYIGKLIKIAKVPFRSSRTKISLTELPAGRYFVRWSSNKEVLVGTVIK